MRRVKESVHCFGKEVDDLFQSNLEEEEEVGPKGITVSRINREFDNVLE